MGGRLQSLFHGLIARRYTQVFMRGQKARFTKINTRLFLARLSDPAFPATYPWDWARWSRVQEAMAF